MKRNLVSIFISIVLLLTVGECCAFAANGLPEGVKVFINPLYADVLNEDNITFHRRSGLLQGSRPGVAESREELAEMIREKMVSRSEYFTLKYEDTEARDMDFFRDVCENDALQHTGVPYEGDYLMWHYGGVGISLPAQAVTFADGVYTHTVGIYVLYYTTADEELYVTQKVQEVLEDLDIDGKSDYEKTAAIYAYVCDLVEYDHEHYDEFTARYLVDETYKVYYTMFSAYGAVHDGTAVCQGIAQLMYRMLLEEGIDCRLIAGRASGRDAADNHAWNIVKIGNEYFNLDATWDLENSEGSFRYFLLTDAEFESGNVHKRGDDYSGGSFCAAYPMGSGEPLKAFHSGACRIESVHLLKDGTVGIEICIGAEAYEKDLLAYAEIDGVHFPLAEAVSIEEDEGAIIKSFTVRKAPKEMQDGITVTLTDGEDEVIPLYDAERNNVTDAGYRTTVYAGIAEEAKAGDTAFAAVMNDLGSCAQKVLNYKAEEAPVFTGSGNSFTAKTVAGFAQSASGSLPEGLKYAGETLELDEYITANFLFSGNAEDVLFSIDGEPAEAKANGDYYVVSIPGLKAGDLGTPHVITASDGEREYIISASALSYAYKALTEDTSPELQELAKALYVWYGMCRE